MRVLLAPSAFFPSRGGVEELTLKLAQELTAAAHDVVVVTNRWPGTPPEREIFEGVQVHRLDFEIPGRRPASWLRYRRSLARNVAECAVRVGRVDVAHLQCLSTQLPVITRYARTVGAPVLLSTQGEVVMDAGRLYQQSAFMRRALHDAAQTADALTACSRWTAVATARVAPAFAEAQVILNGVSGADWHMASPGVEPVICAWGRHVPQKGFDLLLKAFPYVRAKEPRARLFLGGDGPEYGRLSSAVTDGVELLGSLDRAGVRELLRRSRVAVVPSRIEPFGIVALEALAAGRGLVYSRGTGLHEAAGTCGRSVDVSDPKALAEAILAELQDPTPPETGRERARALDWSRITGDYVSLYERITNSTTT